MIQILQRLCTGVLTLLVLAQIAQAEDAEITGPAITELLSGNTAIGFWEGDAYRQYFSSDGATIYAAKGKRSTRGEWRLSDDGQRYESWWSGPKSNWEVYGIVRGPDGLVWTSPDGKLHPFEMLPGQQLVWPD